MFSGSYNETILNSTKNSKTKKKETKWNSEISFFILNKNHKIVLQKLLSFWKKKKKVFMNVKSEKLFLKIGFDSTEIFVELCFFQKRVRNLELLGLKTKW